MMGSKAVTLDALAERLGLALLRFDYSGTGESPGRFSEGTLNRWLEEAAAVASLSDGDLLLVGSSMGGWIALLAIAGGTLFAALVGGKAGERYHRRVDRAGFVD